MRNVRLSAVLGLFLVVLSGPPSRADRVVMDNGDTIGGRIVSMTGNVLKIKTTYAGTLSIDWSHVVSVATDAPTKVKLSNNDILTGVLSPAEPGLVRLTGGKLPEPVVLQKEDVIAIGKDAVPAKHTPWTGSIDLGLVQMDGNTEKTSVRLAVSAAKQMESDRLEASCYVNYGETDGREDTSQGGASARYKLFHVPKFFSYYEAGVEYDEFQSLDFRSRIGLGVGRQFIDTSVTQLSGRIGGLWINENYERPIQDESYAALALGMDFMRRLGKNLVLTQKISLDVSVEDTEDALLTSETGLRTDLSEKMSLSIVVIDRYDNNPPAGLTENDFTLTTTVGYRF